MSAALPLTLPVSYLVVLPVVIYRFLDVTVKGLGNAIAKKKLIQGTFSATYVEKSSFHFVKPHTRHT